MFSGTVLSFDYLCVYFRFFFLLEYRCLTVLLVSAVQKSKSVICIPLSPLFWISFPFRLGFPRGSAGKESTCNVGDLGATPGLGRSPGEGIPTPVFWPGEFHGLDSWWGHKESDTTVWLPLHFPFRSPQSRVSSHTVGSH